MCDVAVIHRILTEAKRVLLQFIPSVISDNSNTMRKCAQRLMRYH